MRDHLLPHVAIWQSIALVLFLALAALVIWYVATDRRKDHLRRMERLALDDDHGDSQRESR